MIVRILAAARTDLELAADFYESQYVGLGAEFLESLVADIECSSSSFSSVTRTNAALQGRAD